jgi:hypothetical protein
MSLIVPWIGLPLVLLAMSLGCALAVERVSGVRIAGALMLPLGLATAIVIAQALTAISVTARLATPAVILVAVAGLVVGRREARRALGPWLIAAGVVYLVYGAPVLATGAATYLGWIRLDDNAAWLAIIDNVMTHGRSIAGLSHSTYASTLDSYLPNGYPLGGFLALGVVHQVLGTDAMWLYQPFLAYAAAMLALALYELSRSLLPRTWSAVAVASIAAQPATLYAYALWGGIKELVAAALLPLVAALAGERRDAEGGALALLPLAIACSALLATLSAGAIVWIVPLALPALLVGAGATRRAPWRALKLRRVGWLALLGAVCSLPVIALAATFLRPLFAGGPGGGGVFANASQIGTLFHRLSVLQLAGIWPVGDFRVAPAHAWVADVLIAVAVVLGAAGVALALRRRQYALPAYVLPAVLVALAIRAHSSPWVDAKSLAQSSPAILLAALSCVAVVWQRPAVRRAGWVAGAVLAAGVLWSNVLGYRGVNVAPRDQLLELTHIAPLAAGQGPTLVTDASYIGPFHILRAADANDASGPRGRQIRLSDGKALKPGEPSDIDAFDQNDVWGFRSLVVRRAPNASRPPAAYRLRWAGRYFELWQRPRDARQPVAHLALGTGGSPGGVAACPDVERLARVAGKHGQLATVGARISGGLALGPPGPVPRGWRPIDVPGGVIPTASGTIERDFSVRASGANELWLGGSSRGRTTVLVDGRVVGHVSHELNWPNRYMYIADVDLAEGSHRMTLRYDAGGLPPGVSGERRVDRFYLGPVVIGRKPPALPVVTLPAAQARELCGKRLDWIEAMRAPER